MLSLTRPLGLRRAYGSLTLLALTLAGLGCGTAADPAPQGPGTATPAPSTPAAPSSSAAAGSWNADGDSFGVDRARWPRTVAAAEPLLRRMPKTFAGQPGESHVSPAQRDEDGGSGAEGGVDYGDETSLGIAEAYVSTDSPDGKAETLTAKDLLSINFGLVFGCAESSYRGTATPMEGGLGPALGKDQPDGPVWFSCRIAGAEGDDAYTGHVVGWTSGKTAWLVIARDAESVRALVTLAHDAAG